MAVILPLSLPGMLAGAVLIFVPVIGSFMEPRILGGTQGAFIGTVIEDQFTAVFNWPLGAALSFILLAVVLLDPGAGRAGPAKGGGHERHGSERGLSGRVYLALVLVFLYAPILVMAVMSFNASPFYQLPFRLFDAPGISSLATTCDHLARLEQLGLDRRRYCA